MRQTLCLGVCVCDLSFSQCVFDTVVAARGETESQRMSVICPRPHN